jgi:hypothetical protein
MHCGFDSWEEFDAYYAERRRLQARKKRREQLERKFTVTLTGQEAASVERKACELGYQNISELARNLLVRCVDGHLDEMKSEGPFSYA